MAEIDQVTIANMALSHLGNSNIIEDFGEQSPEADQARLWYDYSRLQSLEDFDWFFARRRATLASSEQGPPPEWAYRYVWPADCVAPRKIPNPAGDEADPIPYAIEMNDEGSQNTILTNLDEATLVYTRDISNTKIFTPNFVLMFSYQLAYHMAMPITKKVSIEDRMLNRYNQLLAAAPAKAANQEMDKPPRESELIRSRQ